MGGLKETETATTLRVAGSDLEARARASHWPGSLRERAAGRASSAG